MIFITFYLLLFDIVIFIITSILGRDSPHNILITIPIKQGTPKNNPEASLLEGDPVIKLLDILEYTSQGS